MIVLAQNSSQLLNKLPFVLECCLATEDNKICSILLHELSLVKEILDTNNTILSRKYNKLFPGKVN